MNILLTGASGFLGKHLRNGLNNTYADKSIINSKEDVFCLMECNSKTTEKELAEYCKKADVVYHFAAVMRPFDKEEFNTVNIGLTKRLISLLEETGRVEKLIFASSLQASLEGRFAGSDYGISKKEAERLLCEFAERTQVKVYIYRFPNIFGKWCRPNYCSVIATFCHNISRDIPIWINDASVEIETSYVEDLVDEMLLLLNDKEHNLDALGFGKQWKFCYIPQRYYISVGNLAKMIYRFKKLNDEQEAPDMTNPFVEKMWNTYLSYLPGNTEKNDLAGD